MVLVAFRADDELEGELTMAIELSVGVWAEAALKSSERLMLDVESIAVDVAKTNGVVVKLVGIEAVELRDAANDGFGDIVVDGEVNVAFALVFENRVLTWPDKVAVCEAETEAVVTFAVMFGTRLLKELNEVNDREAETEVTLTSAVVFETRFLNGLNGVAVCEAETKIIVTFAVVSVIRLLNMLNGVVDSEAETKALVDTFVKDRKVTAVRETWPGFIGAEATNHGLSNVQILSMRVTKRELFIGAIVTALRNTFFTNYCNFQH